MSRVNKKSRSPKLKEFEVSVCVELTVSVQAANASDAQALAEAETFERVSKLDHSYIVSVDAYEGEKIGWETFNLWEASVRNWTRGAGTDKLFANKRSRCEVEGIQMPHLPQLSFDKQATTIVAVSERKR